MKSSEVRLGHPVLRNICMSLQNGKSVMFTYQSFKEAFEKDFNVLKGETADTEMRRWIEFVEHLYNCTCKIAWDYTTINFLKN